MENNKSNATKEKKALLAFEVCGKQYQLSEFELAIKENETELADYLTLLQDFPYTVRNIRNERKTKQIPVSILYNGLKLSLYDFFEGNRSFDNEIPNIYEINGLEIKHELFVKLTGFQKHDDYYKTIIETFRVFQDLHFLFASARFALINAHRILHLKSSIEWKDGWEQLWLRATWLNNAIIMYDSCYDKILQSIWIATESFKQNNNNRECLNTIEDIEELYKKCWRRKGINNLPSPYKEFLQEFNRTTGPAVADYSQSIKHRGGIRYKNLFPFGQIYDCIEDISYSTFNTKNEKDLDEVVEAVKKYHIAFRELALNVYKHIMIHFKELGYV